MHETPGVSHDHIADESRTVTVRVIAPLDTPRREQGLSSTFGYELPAGPCVAEEIASQLHLPLDRVEGIFLNHRVAGLDAIVSPGDRVAFVPLGTGAASLAFFGPFVTRDAGPDDRADDTVRPDRAT